LEDLKTKYEDLKEKYISRFTEKTVDSDNEDSKNEESKDEEMEEKEVIDIKEI
jgi:pantothenate kinase